MKTTTAFLLAVCLGVSWVAHVRAADQWIEVTSPHFVVVSNAGDRATRSLAWQLEQVRSAMAAMWPWARIDLRKPLTVIAVGNETAMHALAPAFWERRGAVRPASVWVSGPERHYLAIRTDVRASDTDRINPHVTAYFSYISLIMGQSLDRDLPLWFSRGLAGVLSNTLVREDFVLVGSPIPWELQRVRERSITPLPAFLKITAESPQFTEAQGMERFDAQSWAFVHFLMFGEEGKRLEALDRFAQLVSVGNDAQAAFTEALGRPEALVEPFAHYIDRNIFSMMRVKLDVTVERERFPVRKLGTPESATARAMFHAAMRVPAEARKLIDEARKADPKFAESYLAEALLLDAEGKPDEARIAYAKAVELGSSSAYAHYRLAGLTWRADADSTTLEELARYLGQAIKLNDRYAEAYSWLGEVRALLDRPEAMGLVSRAIALEPREAVHRLRAAFVLAREQKFDEAKAQAQAALRFADSEEERNRAKELLERIARATGGDS